MICKITGCNHAVFTDMKNKISLSWQKYGVCPCCANEFRGILGIRKVVFALGVACRQIGASRGRFTEIRNRKLMVIEN